MGEYVCASTESIVPPMNAAPLNVGVKTVTSGRGACTRLSLALDAEGYRCACVESNDVEQLRAQLALTQAREAEVRRLLVDAYQELERRSLRRRAGDAIWKVRVALVTKLRGRGRR